MNRAIPIVVLVFVSTLFLNSAQCESQYPKRTSSVKLLDLQNKHNAEVDPRSTLFQFWASWCHSCFGLMWDLHELTADFKPMHYRAVSIDQTQQQAMTYISKHPLFKKEVDRFYFDATQTLEKQFNIATIPTIIITNAENQIILEKRGHLNSQDFQDIRIALLSIKENH